MPSPAYEKDNPLTQMMSRVKQINAAAGMPAGRGASDQPIQVGSGPSVRSAAMQNPPPLTPEEQARRDAAARKLGILPPDPDEDPNYPSLEAAMEAGMPVPSPEPPVERMTAREFINAHPERAAVQARFDQVGVGAFSPPPTVRLPDFRKVTGFDFFRNVIYIDGLEFDIPEDDVRDMKRYAVDIALNQVVKHLAEALVAFGVPAALAQATADSVREGAANGAQSGQGEGTSPDAVPERLGEGSDQAAEGSPSAE